MALIINHLSKSFGEHIVLKDFNADIPTGQVTLLTAPSGKGKTTLLRILMGLETADSGEFSDFSGLKQSAVFQEDRLCENLSALSNIKLASPQLQNQIIEEALSNVGLKEYAHCPISEFSGGMKRRVAILRALLADYDILFLDEPFKGLDAETKALVMSDVKQRSQGKTVILVTHDPTEAEILGAVYKIEL
ncbi:MAG: ABC transporter ATP-binding protein [Clostridium sp.]|nr:ABC transporter ATP-binding protein [Clostridium sp.]